MSEQVSLEQQNSFTMAEDTINEDRSMIEAETTAVPKEPETTHLQDMENEAARLRQIHSELSQEVDQEEQEKKDIDSRSIYVGNVDYGTSPLELQQHFSSCGVVNRVTIPTNRFNGQPKGFAYLEFSDISSVDKAVATLDGSTFREREIKVMAKRTNIPGLSVTNRGRGRGSFRGFRGRGRGRGRGARGARGFSRFTPY